MSDSAIVHDRYLNAGGVTLSRHPRPPLTPLACKRDDTFFGALSMVVFPGYTSVWASYLRVKSLAFFQCLTPPNPILDQWFHRLKKQDSSILQCGETVQELYEQHPTRFKQEIDAFVEWNGDCCKNRVSCMYTFCHMAAFALDIRIALTRETKKGRSGSTIRRTRWIGPPQAQKEVELYFGQDNVFYLKLEEPRAELEMLHDPFDWWTRRDAEETCPYALRQFRTERDGDATNTLVGVFAAHTIPPHKGTVWCFPFSRPADPSVVYTIHGNVEQNHPAELHLAEKTTLFLFALVAGTEFRCLESRATDPTIFPCFSLQEKDGLLLESTRALFLVLATDEKTAFSRLNKALPSHLRPYHYHVSLHRAPTNC